MFSSQAGTTALILAVRWKLINVAILLITMGADLKFSDEVRYIPRIFKQLSYLPLFIRQLGKTALDYADSENRILLQVIPASCFCVE